MIEWMNICPPAFLSNHSSDLLPTGCVCALVGIRGSAVSTYFDRRHTFNLNKLWTKQTTSGAPGRSGGGGFRQTPACLPLRRRRAYTSRVSLSAIHLVTVLGGWIFYHCSDANSIIRGASLSFCVLRFSRRPAVRSTSHFTGELLRTHGWAERAALENAASRTTGGRAVSLFSTGIFWMATALVFLSIWLKGIGDERRMRKY